MADEKTYEYFKNHDFIIKGKYVGYVDAMWSQSGIGERDLFDRLVDLYAVSVIVGLRTGRRKPEDNSTDQKRTVQLQQISNSYKRFSTLMKIVLLIDDSRGLTTEEKVREAFDTSPKSEYKYNQNMELFNSYARGGIEYLYEKLVVRPSNLDDEECTDARMSNIMALFNDDMQEI